jgi:chemotaxis protein MotB
MSYPPIPVKHKTNNNGTMWLTSLADLLALLLAFFVLVFSMNEIKRDAWADILELLGNELTQEQANKEDGPTADKNIELFNEQKAFDLAYLENVLGAKIAKSEDLKEVELYRASDRLVLSLVGDTYFGSGGNIVTPELTAASRILGESLRYVKNRIEIYGHSDPIPVKSQDPNILDNWGLSLSRAVSVADSLKRAGYGYPIRTFGMADSRFFELSSVTDVQKKYALARRVDIVIREAEGMGR